MASRVVGKRRIKNNPEERQILTGMIIDDLFLKQIYPIVQLDYFQTSFTKTVAGWCLDYFEQHEEAPGENIEAVFKSKQRKGDIDEKEEDTIAQFLESLSDEFDRTEKRNTKYLASVAEKFFQRRSIELLQEDLSAALVSDDIIQAESFISTWRKPERETSGAINPFNNEEAVRDAFEHSAEPLFRLPGALGEALNDLLVRDSFLAIMGPEKRGKTWWLMYLAKMACRAGLNVAFFAVGDMTQPQMTVRFHIMNSQRSNRAKYCREGITPTMDCYHNQTGECCRSEREGEGDVVKKKTDSDYEFLSYEEAPEHIPCVYCMRDRELRKEWKGAIWWKDRPAVEPLTWREAIKDGEMFMNRYMSEKKFKLSTHANSSINIRGIENLLDTWEAVEGFSPDLILTDYADILAPEDGRKDFRHQQDERWKAMRRVSQERNCLFVTATQADAQSYKRKVIKEDNFSEDKRKYSHVTAVLTLNQDAMEKRQGLMRLGLMFLRDEEFDTSATVKVLQCLSKGQVAIGSYF